MVHKAMGLVLVLLFITGCQPDTGSQEEITPEQSIPSDFKDSASEENPSILSITGGSFDRVAGWLSDEEILYVTREQNQFKLNTYNLQTEKIENLQTMDDSILEVRIHPDLTRIAVVTSSNTLSATIHIFSLNGEQLDELTIESSEMYWDWNTNEPDKLFFSAFYEDWSFDSFVYSSETKELERVETSDPFGKWESVSSLNMIIWEDNDALTGGTIRKISSENMSFKDLPVQNIIYTESYNEVDMTVAISEDQQSFIYTLDYENGQKTATYELPAISNYSQWFIPEIEWLSDGSLMTFEAKEPGLMDTISTTYSLVRLSVENEKTMHYEGPYQSFACAPAGDRCLVGMQLEELLKVENGEIIPWLEIKE
jgi:hypothetical protein